MAKAKIAFSVLLFSLSSVKAEVSFVRDVAPLLLQRCAGCHGPKKAEGGYRLHTFDFLMSAGESDASPIVPGDPDSSELYLRIVESDTDIRMPQLDDPLTKSDAALLRNWIQQGAKFNGKSRELPLSVQLPPRRHPLPPATYRVPIPIFAMAFSPDGNTIAVGGYHEITIWNVENGSLIRRINNCPQRIHGLCWTQDGRSILVGGGQPGEYGEVLSVDSGSGKRLQVYGMFEDVVLGTSVDRDEKRLAACSADRSTRLYDMKSATEKWSVRVHSDWATAVAFSSDGKFVTTSSRDQTVKVHQAIDGRLFTTFNGHRRQLGAFAGRFGVHAVIFDPVTGSALSAGDGNAIRVWNPISARKENGDASDMEQRFFKKGHVRYIKHGMTKSVFSLSVATGRVFVAGADGKVNAFALDSGKPLHTLSIAEPDWFYTTASSTNGDLIPAAGHQGLVHIWDAESAAPKVRFWAAPGYQ